jgi:hypothetical protein
MLRGTTAQSVKMHQQDSSNLNNENLPKSYSLRKLSKIWTKMVFTIYLHWEAQFLAAGMLPSWLKYHDCSDDLSAVWTALCSYLVKLAP